MFYLITTWSVFFLDNPPNIIVFFFFFFFFLIIVYRYNVFNSLLATLNKDALLSKKKNLSVYETNIIVLW